MHLPVPLTFISQRYFFTLYGSNNPFPVLKVFWLLVNLYFCFSKINNGLRQRMLAVLIQRRVATSPLHYHELQILFQPKVSCYGSCFIRNQNILFIFSNASAFLINTRLRSLPTPPLLRCS
jgi:hypothetical protein